MRSNAPHLLEGLLPEAAASLYQRLLTAGRIRLGDIDEPEGLRELIDRGFARESYVGEPVVIPIEPARAVENALLVAQQRMLEQHRLLARVLEQMPGLQHAYMTGSEELASALHSIRVFTDPAEIGALSVEICLSAQREVSNLETAHFTRPPDPRSVKVPPKDVVDRGVKFRNIYARSVLDLPGSGEMLRRCAEAGWEQRIVTELPMKMVLIDERAALLPLDPTGMTGAALVRAPVIVAMLRSYFDLLWHRALPMDSPSGLRDGGSAGGVGNSGRLSAVQERVLRLMLTGATDATVARHLGMSERTVRRHVATLLELLGVDNRVTAAVVAVRDGWV
ncbi:MAG TPA: helix-turn-helix transcriptional regulator [Candidatus Limnocylindrales bacterium]|nr:helix-turn-helix transcriptional regulator [Candidatus Limnocylindrales bacterium]